MVTRLETQINCFVMTITTDERKMRGLFQAI